MTTKSKRLPPIERIHYRKGDLIIKQGDYGITIYKIISGKVKVYLESGSEETNLEIAGPDEMFGEMAFLTGSTTTRSASARALEDTELEVWHPSRLLKEYSEIPPILKYILNQSLKRLVRTNKRFLELIAIRKKRGELEKELDNSELQLINRQFYRKELKSDCTYCPVGFCQRIKLWGRTGDISKGGVKLNIKKANTSDYSHSIGDEFKLSTYLTTGKNFSANAKIVNIRNRKRKNMISLGMAFTNFSRSDEQKLGFFLMK